MKKPPTFITVTYVRPETTGSRGSKNPIRMSRGLLDPNAEFTTHPQPASQEAVGSRSMRARVPCLVGPTMFPGSTCS